MKNSFEISSEDNFRESRRKGIGGTDISAIIGINPYKTAYEVYLEKVEGHEKDLSGNEAIKRGKIFEEPAAQLYELKTGKKLYCTGTTSHKEYPFLIANPDRLIPEESRGIEIKTVGRFSQQEWGQDGSQIIPEHYYMQIAHYMFVLDYQYWDVAALFNDYELRVYSFERNLEIDKIILESGQAFWKNHVEAKNPPVMDFKNPYSKDFIKSLYKNVDQETVELGQSLIQEVEVMKKSKIVIKHWKEAHDISESKILSAMGNSEIGIFSNGDKFIRKLIKRKGFTVNDSEYIRLDFKKSKGEENG